MKLKFLMDRRTFAADDPAGTPPADGATPPAGNTPPAGDTPPAGNTPPAGDTPPADSDDNPHSWFGDGLDADAKQYLDAKSFKQPKDLYKSLRAAEKMIRGDHIAGPPEDAEKHGDWLKETGLAKRLGIPDEPTGYEVAPPEFDEEIRDQIPYDDARHGRLLETAHKLNLTPGQVEGVLGFYSAEIAADAQTYTTEAQADEQRMQTDLKREWGDGYDTNLRAAMEVATEVGLDEQAVESLRVAKVAGSTQLTKILHELAVSRGNDTLKGGGKGGGGVGAANPQQALQEFTSKNTKALTDREHPEHASAFARMQELKRAAGRGST